MEQNGKKSSSRRTRHYHISFLMSRTSYEKIVSKLSIPALLTRSWLIFYKAFTGRTIPTLTAYCYGDAPNILSFCSKKWWALVEGACWEYRGRATAPLDNLQVDEGSHGKLVSFADALWKGIYRHYKKRWPASFSLRCGLYSYIKLSIELGLIGNFYLYIATSSLELIPTVVAPNEWALHFISFLESKIENITFRVHFNTLPILIMSKI